MDSVDVFVIGGGGTGSEVAFSLARSSGLSVALAERDKLLASLHEKVLEPMKTLGSDTADPAAIRRKLEGMNAETSRIETALERLPSLGLVTERGGG